VLGCSALFCTGWVLPGLGVTGAVTNQRQASCHRSRARLSCRTDDDGTTWPIAISRGTRIRTGGLPLPKRTRYQAAPHPVMPTGATNHRATGSRLRQYERRDRRVGFSIIDRAVSCGCSSMVEPQPSKLVMPVRSRSPAPKINSTRSHGSRRLGARPSRQRC
jgi:hypothetical protein